MALAIGSLIVPSTTATFAFRPAVNAPQSSRFAVSAAESRAVLAFAPAAGALNVGQDLVITGNVTNPTATAIAAGTASILLNRAVIRSRDELRRWLDPAAISPADPLGPEVLAAITPEVPGGRTVPMQFTVPAAAINLGSTSAVWGVRSLAVRMISAGVEIGQVRSSIVWNPVGDPPKTKLALVAALTVPQSSDGLIPSDLLADYTGSGGLLTRRLNEAINQPNVTIGIDPRILASIRILGNSAPTSATDWLARLESATNNTFALGYGDYDLAAASQAKASRLLAPTSFPIDETLFPKSYNPSPDASQSASPTPGTGGTPAIKTLPDINSLQSFNFTLPAVAWPAKGTVIETDLENFAAGGLTTTILGSANVSFGSLDHTSSSARTIGKYRVLVSDDIISSSLDEAISAPTEALWDTSMSNLASAIAVVSSELPTAQRTIVATIDRTNPALGARFGQTISALNTLTWAAPATLTEAAAGFGGGTSAPPITATLTPRPEPGGRIQTVTALFAAEARAGAFSSVLADPTHITGERRLTLLALLSNSWTNDSGWVGATAKYLATSNRFVTKSVTIARTNATVFTSRNSPLPITVSNAFSWPITVYVSVRSPSNIITIDRARVALVVEGQSQAKTTVPVTSNANGPVTLSVTLTSASNVIIAGPADIDVDVQAQWETALTAVVALFVLAMFGFGIYRTIAKRRRSAAPPASASEATEPAPSSIR